MMIIETEIKGRCVFADKEYKRGEIIETCQAIKIPHEQIEILKKTVINDYWFGLDGYAGDALILLGNGSLYNHSLTPNMEVVEDNGVTGFIALRDISWGEELTFNYGYALANTESDYKLANREEYEKTEEENRVQMNKI